MGLSGKGKTGDLLVTVEVAVPQRVNGKAKAALAQYADATSDDDPRRDLMAQAGKE